MKTLYTLVLCVVLSLSVFAQIRTANNWRYVPGSLVIDSLKTGNTLDVGFQVFSNYGSTSENYFQVTWAKNFSLFPEVPDTLVINSKLMLLVGRNIRIVGARFAIQDSSSYFSYGSWISLSEEWKEMKFPMAKVKKIMKNFGKLYLVFLLSSEDSCDVGVDVAVSSIYGVSNTLGVSVYDNFGSGSTGILNNPQGEIPKSFVLNQNYPNPFNPSTTIKFTVLQKEQVRLTVFNLLGQEIKTLVNEEKGPGSYEVVFNASNLPSGVYFYKLQAGAKVESRKMFLSK